jgi:hypothetical protein
MDVLKRLFEEHYKFPAENLAASGAAWRVGARDCAAERRGVQRDWDCVPGARGECRVPRVFAHFRRHGLPVPEIYAEDLKPGRVSRRRPGRYDAVRVSGRIARARRFRRRSRRIARWWRRCRDFRSRRAGSELQGLLSAGELRPAVDCVGPELFQVLLSAAGRRAISTSRRWSRILAADEVSAERRPRLFSVSGFSVAQCDAARWAAVFLDYQGGRKGALQYDIASLLYDGKAALPPELRQELLDYYLDCLAVM